MKFNLRLIYLFILLFSFSLSYSQGSGIKGVVIEDKTGQSLPGATVSIKGLNKSRVTDAEGNFMFSNIEPGSYELTVTAMSFQQKDVSEVIVIKDEVYSITISLSDKNNELQEVVITNTKSNARVESVKSLLIQQKNSATVSDGISAESIKRTPDKNTSDVLKRISGASIQDNKFVVIRGLNDRYNAALLNGAPLPSSEPDRKAFSFDIFPSNMLDNLVITKTASPDLPGEFAGGVIQIATKSVPEKDFQSLTIGTAYNTVTTFKEQKNYKGSPTDWLGIDDGTRDIPSTIPSTDVFNSLTYQEKAKVAESFESDWNIYDDKFKPNTNFQYSIGHHFDYDGKVLGILFSASHNITNNFNEIERNTYEYPVRDSNGLLRKKYLDNNYSQQVLTGALANFSFKFNQNHNINFKNILSINSNDLVVEKEGKPEVTELTVINSSVRWFTSNRIYSGQFNGDHYFSEPKIRLNWTGFYSDIKRSIPNLRRNVYGTADPNSADPNDRIAYALIPDNNGGPEYGGGMFFAENLEDIYGAKLDVSKKFTIGEDLINEIKIGGFTQTRDRDFYARQLQYNILTLGGNFNYDLLKLPDATIFNVENMGVITPANPPTPAENGFTLYDGTKATDTYKAGSKLNAGYLMLDNRCKSFRLVWGVRFEDYLQTLNSWENESKANYLNLHKRQLDVLPSANLIYSINKKQNLRFSYSKTLNRPEFRELAPFGFYDFTTGFFTQGNPNLKICEIQNIDLRYEFYPGKGQMFSFSYFNKKFTNPIEIIQGLGNVITYDNANSGKNKGVELEFRLLLSSFSKSDDSTFLDDLTLFTNLAIIKSTVDVSNFNQKNTKKNRPLQGQSPYVFNAGLQYFNKDNGWSVATNLNTVGNRVSYGEGEEKPALWERGRTFLDMQIAKSFNENKMELKLNIQNLLAQDLIVFANVEDKGSAEPLPGLGSQVNYIFTGSYENKNGYDSKTDDTVWVTKYGRTISLSFTYNF